MTTMVQERQEKHGKVGHQENDQEKEGNHHQFLPRNHPKHSKKAH